MLSACSNQDKPKETVFKGESEHWKMVYTVSSNQKVKNYNGKETTSNTDSIRIQYKGDKKDLDGVERYKITVLGSGAEMYFGKKMDKTFRDTGEVYIENSTLTTLDKNPDIGGQVILDGRKRESMNLKPE